MEAATQSSTTSRVARAVALGLALIPFAASAPAQNAPPSPRSALQLPADGPGLYRNACAACHGGDGRGVNRALVMFEDPIPDLTDCSFASREAAADWVGVAHEGGPLRGLSQMMPAFGSALTVEQLERVVTYMKSLCRDRRWPQGELNLPRALFTEKAYPEDEWVLETASSVNAPEAVINALIYEKRFGAKSQLELAIPYNFARVTATTGGSRWVSGPGDISVGIKHVLSHSVETGYILTALAEMKLPTGNRADGFGTGAKAAEATLAFGKIFPYDAFLQLQAGGERVIARNGTSEIFWRGALGRTFTQRMWGRMWSPMIEILGAKEQGESALWDMVPQLHVTLNRRRHVMVTLGPRLPMNQRSRPKSFVVSFIWDFFDGGLFEGW